MEDLDEFDGADEAQHAHDLGDAACRRRRRCSSAGPAQAGGEKEERGVAEGGCRGERAGSQGRCEGEMQAGGLNV